MIRTALALKVAAALLAAAVFVPAARAQPAQAPLRLLDVPYLPQTELLCGGAAAAMVMRYWGATDVYAETFEPLVDNAAGGIRGDALLGALRARGWQAASLGGDPAVVQAHLAARRPVIALVLDRPGRFHYVVVVGWAAGRVVVHDPARAPFRILDERDFIRAWEASGFWTFVTTPAPGAGEKRGSATGEMVSRAESEPATAGATAPCAPMVEQAVRLAGAGELEPSRHLLQLAVANCPNEAAPWREMAGLHALGGNWRQAVQSARRAVERDRNDPHAWRILATGLYLEGDQEGALTAWNHIGEPVIDLVNVTGLERTRYAVAAGVIALPPQRLLTAAALQMARRRLGELPSAQTARVAYRPSEGGRAQIDAVVLERPKLPIAPVAIAATGLRVLTDHELSVAIASPTGGGEVWSAAWRWWEHRPRVSAGFSAPAPFGGVWSVAAFGEQQSYSGSDTAVVVEDRRGASFQVSDWTPRGLRWEGSLGFDRWRGSRRAMALGIAGRQLLAGDHVSIEGRATSWVGGVRTWTLALRSDWRSGVRTEGVRWSARAGLDIAGESAPLALWSGAGTGQGREVLLRAHPLLDDGVIRDGVFGRRIVHGSVEWRRWTTLGRVLRIAPAVWVDTARAAHGLRGFDRRWHVDTGAGLRIALPGAGTARIDLAKGMRDGAMALAVGWTR